MTQKVNYHGNFLEKNGYYIRSLCSTVTLTVKKGESTVKTCVTTYASRYASCGNFPLAYSIRKLSTVPVKFKTV